MLLPVLARERAVALELATLAAHLCERVFATRVLPQPQTTTHHSPKHNPVAAAHIKRDASPVTVADFGVQALVGTVLRSLFPADLLIAEESSRELTAAGPDLVSQVLDAVNGTVEATRPLWDTNNTNNTTTSTSSHLDDPTHAEVRTLIASALNTALPFTEQSLAEAIDSQRYPDSDGETIVSVSSTATTTTTTTTTTRPTTNTSSRVWTLDPVDGTKGFLRGGQYAVCIGLLIKGKVELGVLGCPNLPFTEAEQHGIADSTKSPEHNINDEAETAHRRALFRAEVDCDIAYHDVVLGKVDPIDSMQIVGAVLPRGCIFSAVRGQGAFVRRFEHLFGRHKDRKFNLGDEKYVPFEKDVRINMMRILPQPPSLNSSKDSLRLPTDNADSLNPYTYNNPFLTADRSYANGGYIHRRSSSSTSSVYVPQDHKDDRTRIQLQENISSMVFVESVESGHSSQDDSKKIAKVLGIRAQPVRMDSQCKYGALALGVADIYLRLPVSATYVEKIWDHTAGSLIVEEAGGVVTDAFGNSLDFTHGRKLIKNKGIIVSPSPEVHEEVLRVVADVLASKTS